MKVVGGVYREICERPYWDRLFGSGLRAAAAISSLSPGSELHAYVPRAWRDDVIASAKSFRLSPTLHSSSEEISFSYFHPLSRVTIDPPTPSIAPTFEVSGEVVLRFGFIEGDVRVGARSAVYDPQTGQTSPTFRSNGSTAQRLAVVLNAWEAEIASGETGDAAGRSVLEREQADTVVIKNGPRGARVFEPGRDPVSIPAYRSETVFKIGSGDVFSAAFAHYWGERRWSAADAADAASRSVAHFANGHVLPLVDASQLVVGEPVRSAPTARRVYLAAPFFGLSQLWLVDEAVDCLERLEVPLFSPLHAVGTGGSSTEIAMADLEGLRSCGAMLAILDGIDPGTFFEVGFARALEKKVVGLAEHLPDYQRTMFEGTGCRLTADFSTALYMAAWDAWEP